MMIGQSTLPAQSWVGKEIGERIRQARGEAGLSQSDLGRKVAAAIGRRRPLSQAAISDMERGDAAVTFELITIIAEVLNKEISFFDVPGSPSQEALKKLGRANFNLESWKKDSQLSPTFPQLQELEESDLDVGNKLYLSEDHRRAVDEIQDRAGRHPDSSPLIVLVPRGHGCSTVSRYISKQMSENVRARVIPIHLCLEQFAWTVDSHDLAHQVEATVGDSIISSLMSDNLISRRWQRVFGGDRYTRLLEATRPAQSNGQPKRENGDSQGGRHEIGTNFSNGNGASLADLSKKVAQPVGHITLDHLLDQLAQQQLVSVSLQLDCSSKLAYTNPEKYEALLTSVVEAVHAVYERDVQKRTPVRPAILTEIYFMDVHAFELFANVWPRADEDGHVMEYPWYRAADVIGILAHQHLDVLPGRSRAETLRSLIDPGLFEGIVGPHIALGETIRLLERRLLRLAADWEGASGQLFIAEAPS